MVPVHLYQIPVPGGGQNTVRERELELGKREKALAKAQAAADERTTQLATRQAQVCMEK